MDNQTLAGNLADIVNEATAAGGVVVDMISNAVEETKAQSHDIIPPDHFVTEHDVAPGAPSVAPADSSASTSPSAPPAEHAAQDHEEPATPGTEEYMKQFGRVQEYLGMGVKFVDALHDAPDDEARVKALIAHCKHLHELLQETYKLIVHQHNFFSPE